MNIHGRACVQSVHRQHAHTISDSHATAQSHGWCCPGQSQTMFVSSVFAGRRCHEFLFDTHVAVNLRHIGLTTLVHFDEAMIHVSHCV